MTDLCCLREGWPYAASFEPLYELAMSLLDLGLRHPLILLPETSPPWGEENKAIALRFVLTL